MEASGQPVQSIDQLKAYLIAPHAPATQLPSSNAAISQYSSACSIPLTFSRFLIL